jgi:AraC-like DNA-binding protein
VKELLVYDELTLSEIADKLHYSSAAHLSAQFKRETGFSPSVYRKQGAQRRALSDL